MSTEAPDVSEFKLWDKYQLATYFRDKCDLGQYYEAFISNDITGATVARLTEADMKEMGVNSLGDRKSLVAAIEELKKNFHKHEREKILWEGTEVLYFSCFDQCCQTSCGCCPVDPAEYKLSTHHLTIKTVLPNRCGPLRCCFGNEYEIDNIDLTYITSGDIRGEAAPCFHQICCCGDGRDRLTLKTSSEGDKFLVLQKGQGEKVNRMILNQIEVAQKIERN